MDDLGPATRFYCHWDSHSDEVPSFMSELELDMHIRDIHFASPPEDDLTQCHWDACHELIGLDGFMDHYKSSHQEQAVRPHDCCEPVATSQHTEPYVRVHTPSTLKSAQPFNLPSLADVPQAQSPEFGGVCQWEIEPGKICGHVFDMSQDLNTHIAAEHIGSGKSKYVCHWRGCSRNCRPFSQRQKILRHLQTHARNCSHKCYICGHAFAEESILKAHMRIHSGERPFKCDICSKSFASSSALTLHRRTHTGEKPLQCRFPGCGKRFAESSNLTKHMRVHMERQYVCEICEHKFTRRDQLQRHKQKCHDEIPRQLPKSEEFQSQMSGFPMMHA